MEFFAEAHVIVSLVGSRALQVACVPQDDLRAVAADNGFQDWHTEYEIGALEIKYLVHYRGSTAKATVNNALIRTKGYT